MLVLPLEDAALSRRFDVESLSGVQGQLLVS